MTTSLKTRYARQPTFPGLDALQPAVDLLAQAGSEERGAIFTRREVVEFILDLVGYTANTPLFTRRLLEPAFGHGDFLLVAADRLLLAYRRIYPLAARPVDDLKDCLRAVELHTASFLDTRQKLAGLLLQHGLTLADTEELLGHWLIQGDYLLAPLPFDFTHIVGNPPYVRQELIPAVLLAEYRRQFITLFDRADLYVPFIEKSLEYLAPQGELGFICSDRWMKNRYGGPLRQYVADRFHLKYYVDMVGSAAFHEEVTAYPAIIVIAREQPGATRIVHRPEIKAAALSRLAVALRASRLSRSTTVKEARGIVQGQEPWLLEPADQLALMRRLEADFPALEEVGCKVGIGVATGADRVFIGPFDTLDVEPDRKLPLVMTTDISSGKIKWQGLGVINPFAEDGSLVSLQNYPKLAAYLHHHEGTIRRRNVAQKRPDRWYRTIDRIYPSLVSVPKLLIPDIKGEPHIVYEDGRFYPHHNLYFITSTAWDLQALQAVLMSGIARLFVFSYSTRMRGDYLRYQAQYLRRIRVPAWETVPAPIREELIRATEQGNMAARNEAVFDLYQLSTEERLLLHADS
jgi:hypothetical protein